MTMPRGWISPLDYVGWDKRGDVLLISKNYEEALEAYKKALDANPQYLYSLASKGTALFALSRFGDALEAFDKARDKSNI